jgi:hypothetical protein
MSATVKRRFFNVFGKEIFFFFDIPNLIFRSYIQGSYYFVHFLLVSNYTEY